VADIELVLLRDQNPEISLHPPDQHGMGSIEWDLLTHPRRYRAIERVRLDMRREGVHVFDCLLSSQRGQRGKRGEQDGYQAAVHVVTSGQDVGCCCKGGGAPR
jgi:hypothetical protein